MELDVIKSQTTWNDASQSINLNFAKIRQALASIGSGGGTVDALISTVYDVSNFGSISTNDNSATFNAFAIDSLYKRIKILEDEEVDFTGYATEQWVLNKSYITAAALSPYLKTSDANSTFATLVAFNALSNKTNALEGGLETLQSNHSELSNEVESLDDNLGTLSSNFNTLKGRFDALDDALNDDVSGKINTWNEIVDFLDEYNGSKDLATILSGMNADIALRLKTADFDAWKTDVYSPLASSVSTAEGNISTHTTQISGLTSRMGSAETNISTNAKGIADNKTAIATNKSNISANATAITNLGKRVTANEGNIAEILKWFAVDADGNLYTTYNLYSTKEISANGLSVGSGGSGGGLISQVFGTTAFGTIASESNSATFNAYAIDSLYKRIVSLEGKATAVSFVPALTSGKQIGTLSIDGVSTVLYGVDAYSKTDADNTFLKLTGGEVKGYVNFSHATQSIPLGVHSKSTDYVAIRFTGANGNSAYLVYSGNGDEWAVTPPNWAGSRILLHSNNIGNYKAGGLVMTDSRNQNYAPYANALTKKALTSHFERALSVGFGATDYYLSMLHISPWGDNSGGPEHQLAFRADGAIGHRYGSTTWSAWKTLLHSGNYNSYALPLSGGTISGSGSGILTINRTSGTPLISFQANGTNVGFLGIDTVSRPCFVDPVNYVTSYLIHSGNIGSQNAGSADVIATTYANQSIDIGAESRVRLVSLTASNSIELGAPKRYVSGLSVMSNYVGWQLVSGASQWNNDDFFIRKLADNGKYLDWRQLAFTDSNVASATKLATARTIWGQSFDGTGNVSGNIALGAASIRGYDNRNILESTANDLMIGYGYTTSSLKTTIFGNTIRLNDAVLINSSGNVTIGSGDLAGTTYKLYVNGSTKIAGTIYDVNNIYPNSTGERYIGTSSNPFKYMYAEWYGAGTGQALSFGANNGTHIWVNTSGNVTIGSSDLAGTSAKLYVDGHISCKGNLVAKSSAFAISAYNSNTNTGVNVLDFSSSTKHLWYGYGMNAEGYYTMIGGNVVALRYGASRSYGLYLNASGNVGIGTTSPVYKLDVNGSVGIGSSGASDLYLRRANGFSYITATSHLALSTGGDAANVALGLTSDKNATFYGNLEVKGTTTLKSLTSIEGNLSAWGASFNGDVKVQRTGSSAEYFNIEVRDVSVNYKGYDNTDGYVRHRFYSNDTLLLSIDGKDNIAYFSGGLSTVDAVTIQSTLSVTGKVTANYLSVSYDGLRFSDNTNYALFMDSSNKVNLSGYYGINLNGAVTMSSTLSVSGNVGIGTTTPQHKLEVTGDIASSGALRMGLNSAYGAYLQTNEEGGWTGIYSANKGNWQASNMYLMPDGDVRFAHAARIIGKNTDGDTGLFVEGTQYSMWFGIGSGNVNRGIFDINNNGWWIYRGSDTLTRISGGIETSTGSFTGAVTMDSTLAVKNVLRVNDASMNAILNIANEGGTINYVHLFVSSANSSNATTRPLVLQNGYGNVGIGINNPQYKLHINGTARVGDTLSVAGTITANSGVKVASGQALTFLDASGKEHKLTYDSTAGAFKFDGNILVLGDGQFNAIN